MVETQSVRDRSDTETIPIRRTLISTRPTQCDMRLATRRRRVQGGFLLNMGGFSLNTYPDVSLLYVDVFC